MQLSYFQKKQFYEQGYLVIPGVVPPVMVREALRAINHSVGGGMPPEQMTKFRAQSFCPELQGSAVISDLFNRTPAVALAESAIGEGKICPVKGGQIALRFPGMQDPPPAPRPHLDGMHSPTNGVPEGEIHNFTALVGILLSDVTEEYAGNFTVWPGSHHLHEAWFREKGPLSLLEGMPKVALPEPVQVKGKAGDMILAHYLLAHGVAPNTSPNVRYAIFFRLRHVNHEEQRFESMCDAWLQWEGMCDVVEASRAAKP